MEDLLVIALVQGGQNEYFTIHCHRFPFYMYILEIGDHIKSLNKCTIICVEVNFSTNCKIGLLIEKIWCPSTALINYAIFVILFQCSSVSSKLCAPPKIFHAKER